MTKEKNACEKRDNESHVVSSCFWQKKRRFQQQKSAVKNSDEHFKKKSGNFFSHIHYMDLLGALETELELEH